MKKSSSSSSLSYVAIICIAISLSFAISFLVTTISTVSIIQQQTSNVEIKKIKDPALLTEQEQESRFSGLQQLRGGSSNEYVRNVLLIDDERDETTTTTTSIGIESNSQTQTQTSGGKGGKFAYAYVIAGCTLDSCTGYILNAIVASRIWKEHNATTADIILMVRMSNSIKEIRLAQEVENWLRKANIKLRYLPKVAVDNFGTASIEKFRVLELIEYDRVLFLDGDRIPNPKTINNNNDPNNHMGDDIFQQSYTNSDNNLEIAEYVGYSGRIAPITASIFMVTPKIGMFESVMDIIHKHRNTSTIFHEEDGWGHNIISLLEEHNETYHQKWNWYGVGVDQGIIYQWMKYELPQVSIVTKNAMKTYTNVRDNGGARRNKALVSTQTIPVSFHKENYIHFSGTKKPWKMYIIFFMK